MHLIIRQAHEESIQLQRSGDQLIQDLGEGLVGNALDQLADQPAVGECVVAVGGARFVNRVGPLDGRGHVIPVHHLFRIINHVANVVETRLMAQQLPHGDELLGALTELGPVFAHRIVVSQEALVHQNVEQGGGNPFCGGERQ